jgi:TolB-like protein/DNA-binding winged helix-turn-helix (wHTH) protein
MENSSRHVRFADFEFDLNSGDLRRDGTSLKLQPQPAKVLSVLIRREGDVVSRQELAAEVWGSDTFVDCEQGLNYAIRQIRAVLKDDAEQPRFVETVPKRGYRFIAQAKIDIVSAEFTGAADSGRHVSRKILWQLVTALIAVGAAGAALVVGFRLHRQTDGASAQPIRSLAVLPLQNLSGDPEQQYFSDGMTEELITELAKLSGLRVISHTSVERYKNTKKALPDIAQELGVDAIVEGAVLRSNNRVRITAQLIDARSDQHRWAEGYENDLRDVLLLQHEVALRIATQVGMQVAADRQTSMTSSRQVDPETHEAYLKGNFYWNKSTCDGSQKGLSYYQQAVAKDPTFAAAYVGLAQAYFTLGDWQCSQYQEAFSKSKEASLRALELDPSLGPAHAWLATLASFYEWDWDKAEREYRQAVQLSPNYAPAHLLYAVFLTSMARQEQGVTEMRTALELDPTAEFTNMISVHVLYLAHQYDNAIEQADKSMQLYPDSRGTYFWLGAAYERKGMYEQAFKAYLKSESIGGAKPEELSAFRAAYQKSGIKGYWRQVGDTAISDGAGTCSMKRLYARLGDTDKIIDSLNWAFRNHCPSIRTLKVDSMYDELRADPRFKELVSRLNL